MAAVLCAARAAHQQGRLSLRIEDIDTPRVIAGMAEQHIADLSWLGIVFDGPPVFQSTRTAHYEAALARLAAQNLLYLCDCSRGEIARVASAPHEGEEGPIYPGTCRGFGMGARAFKRPPAVRVRLPPGLVVDVHDGAYGRITQDVEREVGDFVLKRGDGVYAYQLAVVVDDAAMGITEVVRGRDLLSSVPRQVLLHQMLGSVAPTFFHTPLVVGAGGARLEKRSRGVPLSDTIGKGDGPEAFVRLVGRAVGVQLSGGPLAVLFGELGEAIGRHPPIDDISWDALA